MPNFITDTAKWYAQSRSFLNIKIWSVITILVLVYWVAALFWHGFNWISIILILITAYVALINLLAWNLRRR